MNRGNDDEKEDLMPAHVSQKSRTKTLVLKIVCSFCVSNLLQPYVQPHTATATCKTLRPFFLSCHVQSCVGSRRYQEGHTYASVSGQRWLCDTPVTPREFATNKKGRACAKRFCTRLVCDTSLLKEFSQTFCNSLHMAGRKCLRVTLPPRR